MALRKPIDENEIGFFGRNSPKTSRDAAIHFLPRSGSDKRIIYDYIDGQCKAGSTADQAQIATGLSHQTGSARCTGLKDDGWIFDSDDRRLTVRGEEAIVWVSKRWWCVIRAEARRRHPSYEPRRTA